MCPTYQSGVVVRATDRQQLEADYQFACMTLEAMRELARRRQLQTGQSYFLSLHEQEIATKLERLRDDLYYRINKERD